MPNIRQRKAAEEAERWRKNREDLYQRKKEEEYKLQKKSEFISELRNVLSKLSNKRDCIQSCIESKQNEQIEQFNKRMSSFAIEFLSVPSTERPQFQIDESFIELLSTSKPRLEEISKQMKFIDELIEKISSNSSDIKISEPEQRIIEILSTKSFLRSQVVASVQRMVNLGQDIITCLRLLEKYSNDFFEGIDDDDFEDPTDFQLDPEMMRSFFEKSAEYVQELTELQKKIEERKELFTKIFSIENLFSVPDDLLSLSESIQQLETELEQKTLDFRKFRETVCTFVEEQNQIREKLFYWVANDLPEQHIFHTQFNEIKGQLKEALKRIKC